MGKSMSVLKSLFTHTNADVRKSVVFCLVEISFLLGDDFDVFQAELAPNQQKLVAIYIQRRMETSG